MIWAGTGHRPDKIVAGSKNAYDPAVSTRLQALAEAALRRHGATLAITGMAQGWDMALADASLAVGIPFDAYVPFVGQESKWPRAAQLRYQDLLKRARTVVVVCPGEYGVWKMQKRNEAMVDAAEGILALWDGSSGGTGNCIAYAERVGRPIENLWKHWVRHATPVRSR